jgi:hypothetical protein
MSPWFDSAKFQGGSREMPARKLLILVSCLFGMMVSPNALGQKNATRLDNASVASVPSVSDSSQQNPDASRSPALIRYDGVFKGKASSSEIAVTFFAYSESDATNPIWQETQNVRPDAAGHYSVFLGITEPGGAPASVFATPEPRWLVVRVPGQEQESRTLLVSAPYAQKLVSGGMLQDDADVFKKSGSFLLTAAASSQQMPGPSGKQIAKVFTTSSIALPITRVPDSLSQIVPRVIIANNDTQALFVEQDGTGKTGVFNSRGGGDILNGRSSGVEKFRVDAQGNVSSSAFIGDGSQLTNVDASALNGLHATDFVQVGAPQNLSGLEALASKQLAINPDLAVGGQFGSATFMREDQDTGHVSGFRQAGPQMHFRLTRAYCDKTSTSQQSASDQANFFCVPDAVTIDDTHPASSTPSKDFIIAPYKFGMGVFYPGLIEVASDEFSVHAHNSSMGAHLWVGDEHDIGGILTTAHDVLNPDNSIDRSQSFVSMTSETFTGGSHGDMLFSVRDAADNFRFQFGPVNAAEAPGLYQQYTKARIDSTGKGFFDGGTQTGGADFAESVSVAGGKAEYEPGDVLVIDTKSDRQVALSSAPYSTLVAGIYSTKPGVTATPHTSEDPRLAGEVPMAIVGIVPCKVTNENGPIARGDLLVTSSTPGYAMRGTDRSLLPGAIIGKALQPFSGTKGKIEVLVTLR